MPSLRFQFFRGKMLFRSLGHLLERLSSWLETDSGIISVLWAVRSVIPGSRDRQFSETLSSGVLPSCSPVPVLPLPRVGVLPVAKAKASTAGGSGAAGRVPASSPRRRNLKTPDDFRQGTNKGTWTLYDSTGRADSLASSSGGTPNRRSNPLLEVFNAVPDASMSDGTRRSSSITTWQLRPWLRRLSFARWCQLALRPMDYLSTLQLGMSRDWTRTTEQRM